MPINKTLYQQIADKIAMQIEQQIYLPGDKLPSIRTMSKQLGVSISTVQQAYHVLEIRRMAEARTKSGYYVRRIAQVMAEEPKAMLDIPGKPLPVSISERASSIFQQCQQPDLINLGTAFPAPAFLPIKQLQNIIGRLAKQKMREAVVADFSAGHEELRRQITQRLLDAGCQLSPSEIVITNGCQDALSLALLAVAKPGDTIAIETPTFVGLLQVIEALGMNALEIPTHPQEGISLDALSLALEKWPIKACALVPTFNNPLGSSMPENKKAELVALLEQYDVPLIEDDSFGDLAFADQREKAAKAFDKSGNVLYCSSVSKSIGPGLRIGWISAGRYQQKVLSLRSYGSMGGATISQMAVAEFMAKGAYDRHIRRIRNDFARQVQLMSATIARHFPEGTTITRPSGGYILWIGLPQQINTWALYQLAIKKGIAIVPGMLFSTTHKYDSFFRVNCAIPWSDRVENAVIELAQIAKSLMQS